MGGLAGVVHFRGASPARSDAERIAAELAHRGPDGAGAWAEREIAVAHRIRRVRPGNKLQPVVADDLVVMLDGWIYDHLRLVAELDPPADATDTESLLLAWRRWGVETLGRLEGEFAIAVWDRRASSLTLARDRLGIRPLHYAARGDKLAFASEARPLFEVEWVGRDPDPMRIAEYLSFGVVHAPRTLLRDVFQVEPGSFVRADRDGLRTRSYWRLGYAPPGTPKPSESDVIPALQARVEQAVSRRIPEGVPTGLYLSGGLGSAAVAASARRLHRLLPGFTVSFADDPYPESAFAGRVATLFGIDHHEVVVRSSELAAGFDAVQVMVGQPIGSPGAVLQVALARAAAGQVKVALSGDGSEELFGGRMLDGLGRALSLAHGYQQLPRAARSALGRLAPTSRRLARWSTPVDRFALDQGLGGAHLFDTDDRRAVLRDPALVRPEVRQEVLTPFYSELATDPINTVLHGFLRSSLVETQLVRADRTAAANGLDIRFPLLDRAVVEAAAALPGAFKQFRVAGSVHTRWPLRALLMGELPEVLVDRPKRGPPGPPANWLATAGRLFLEDRVHKLTQNRHGLWRVDAIEHLRADVARSNAATTRLWALFALDSWLEQLG
ncbi:MAG: asparagine synthase (glutamine-hydrolyzing) [Myxococcota bacterium]